MHGMSWLVPPRRWLVRCAVVALLALIAVALTHAPPVRSRVLAFLLARLSRAGIVAHADRLDYNLARLEVHLDRVSLATPAATTTPFLTADHVHVVGDWRLLLGRFNIAVVELTHPRVVLTRTIDGASNWPAPQQRSATAPPAIQVGRLNIPDLDLVWRDAVSASNADLTRVSLDLAAVGGTTSGSLRMNGPGRLQWNDRTAVFDTVDGRVGWNGRDLTIDALRLEVPEGRLRTDGRVDSLLGDPRLDLRIGADAGLGAIARWFAVDRSFVGAIRIDAHATGEMSRPALVLTLAGRDIAGSGLPATSVEASARISDGQARLATLTARVAGGEIKAEGETSLDGGPGTIRVNWSDLDVAALLRPIQGAGGVQLAARAIGSLDARWTAMRLDALRAKGDGRITTPDGDVGKRLPLDGPIAFELHDRQWTVRTEQTLDKGARLTAAIVGELDAQRPAQSTLSGDIRASAPDLAALARTLAHAGLGRAGIKVYGAAQADLSLHGTVAEPRLEGTLQASGAGYESIGPATLRARTVVTRERARLDEIDVRVGQNSVGGRALLVVDTGRLDGQFSGALLNLSQLAGEIPPLARPAGAVDVRGSLSGFLASPGLEATLTSGGIDVAGQHIDRLDAHIRSTAATITVDDLRAQSDGGRVDAKGQFDLARRTYALHATATDLPVRPVPEVDGSVMLPVTAILSGQVDGEGAFANLSGRARVALADVTWGNAKPGAIEADLTAAGQRVSIDLRAPDLATTASADVGIGAATPVSVRGRFEPADLAALARRLGWSPPFPFAGSAAAGFAIAGRRDRLDALRIDADLERLTIDVDRQTVRLDPPARVEYDAAGALRVRNARLSIGGSRLAVDGSIGEPGSSGLDATLHGSVADFAFVQHFARPVVADDHADLPEPTGTIDLRVHASGPLAAPVLSGTLRLDAGRIPLSNGASVIETAIAANYDLGTVVIEEVTAAFEGATLVASGRVPADFIRDRLPPGWRSLIPQTGAAARLTAKLSALTPRVAAPFVEAALLENIGGYFDASIDLTADRGALDRVEGSVVLTRADLSLSGVSFEQQAPTRLEVRDGRANIVAWDWGRDDNRVTLAGGIALGGARDVNITATGALDLALLNAFIRTGRTAGRADAKIRLGGTMSEPTVDGFVTFAQGELRMTNPRLIATDFAGTVTLDRDALTLQRLYATVNGGATEIAGVVHHRWFQPIDGQVTLRARNAALDLAGLRSEANADLRFTLEPRGPQLTGTITLLRGAYREPLSLTGGLLQALRTSSTAAAGPPSALDALRLDVRVVTADELLVDNNYAKLAATADLRLIGTPAQPAIVGRAALAEGGLIFFGGRRYRLETEGSIDFVNTTTIEPDISLRAVTRVGETTITLALNGTPATLDAALTSDSSYSEGELVSLLATGRATTDSAASGYSGGGAELIGLLSGELFGAAGRAVGLDTVRVEQGTSDVRFDAGLVATETDPGARLTFGKNIGRRAQVVFSQSLRDNGDLTWIVSYAPHSSIELRAVSLDNGDRLYGLRHDIVFGASSAPAAQTRQPQPRIAEIQIAGAGRDETVLRSKLTLEPGHRFSFFQWQDDRERLERFYQEHDRVEARVTTRRTFVDGGPAAGGVALVYEVRPGPRTGIAIAGASLSSSAVATMKRAWTSAVVDQFLIEEVEAIARGEMVDRGFVHASVSAVLEQGPEQRTLRVVVDPGAHSRHRDLVFAGNRLVPATRLHAVVAEQKLARAIWLEPERVRDALAAFYRSQGFLHVRFTIGPIATAGDGVTRQIDVDEGEPFRVRQINVEGAHVSSPDEIRGLITLAPGERFSEAAIEQARQAVARSYRARGFNALGLTLRTEAAPEGPEVDVTIAVDEGPQQRVRDVTVAGLVRTRPDRVTRALGIEHGAPVNLAEWANARRRLYGEGVFRSVDIQPEPMATLPAPEPALPGAPVEQPVRVKVTLSEWPPLRLRYGLEVDDQQHSATDEGALAPESTSGRMFGLSLAGDIGARNLFGNAIAVGVAGRYSRDFTAARAYATSPSFLGWRITSNAFVSRAREQLGQGADATTRKFVTDITSLTLEQRVRPFARTEISYRYSFERNHTFDLTPAPDDPIPFDVEANVARLASTVLVDTRNDLVDTSGGWFHSSDLEYGPSALGSDLRFIKYLVQQRYFRNFGGVVVATAARMGMAKGFDGQSLIPSERFFAGGGNSVRGYGEDALGARNVFGAAVGGAAMLVLNEEIRFPIYRMVRGVGFFDAGQVFETIGSLTLKGLPVGTGFGLRVQTPIVLLRFDVAVPLDRARSVGQRRPNLFFSIGQAF